MSKIEIIVKLMESNFDACYLMIRFGDFSLDFTERVTYIYNMYVKYVLYSNLKMLLLLFVCSGLF